MIATRPHEFVILIVDDTTANLQTLDAILTKHGFKTRVSTSGTSALSASRRETPDLILLDIRMPDMDGYEVCKHLKKSDATKNIPVIFISALDDAANKIKAFEAGGVDYITKPFRSEEVLARVRTHLSLRQMQEKLEHQNIQLKQANAKLEELDRLKSMFIASMSHELRTPLNSIIGFSGLMLHGVSGKVSELQYQNLERIYRSGNHLLALISDIIDISKIEAGRIDVYPEECSLDRIVHEAIESIRPNIEEKRMELLLDVSSWPLMVTDRKRLMQCLLNLLSNAIKYSEKGQVTIRVRENDKDVDIAVTDTGIGIPEQDLPKLFGAFERLRSHLQVKAGGTGLGLYLTKKIACDVLQGDVSVNSQLGIGSTFTLHIPKTLQLNSLQKKEIPK